MDTPQIKLRRFSRNKEVVADPEPEPEPVIESQPSMVTEVSGSDNDADDDDMDGFLDSLKRGKFKKEDEPEPKKKQPKKEKKVVIKEEPKKEDDGILADIFANPKKKGKKADEFGDLFGSDPTPILGKDKRTLLTRAKQFKALFPDELKSFKLKANANVQELQDALDEMDVIVSVGGIQGIINEAYFTSIGMLEGISSRYETMNISGTADLLRQNPEVAKLLKMVSIKYGLFANAPPESQLLLLTCSTMLICRQQNLKRGQVRSILNTEI